MQSNLSTRVTLGTEFTGYYGEVAIVEVKIRANLSTAMKTCGRCREVAVMGRWPFVEVRL